MTLAVFSCSQFQAGKDGRCWLLFLGHNLPIQAGLMLTVLPPITQAPKYSSILVTTWVFCKRRRNLLFEGQQIYESLGDGTPIGRTVLGRELATIHDYRQRLNQYRTDASLVAAHQNAPWITVW